MTKNASPPAHIAVIGGGVAGVVCAKYLSEAGACVTIFEKSRGLGGRLATRRTPDEIHFDHGAQYFTIRDPEFETFLKAYGAWQKIEAWQPVTNTNTSPQPLKPDTKYVGAPTMNGWLKHLAEGVEQKINFRVERVEETEQACRIKADGFDEEFDFVIITAPPPQIPDLVGDTHCLVDAISSVEMAPCWTLMMSTSAIGSDVADIFTSDTKPIAWLARNASKPERADVPQTWVAQASPGWSKDHLELERDDVIERLMPEVCALIGVRRSDVTYETAHRWRYARVTKAAEQAYLSHPNSRIILAGDWCLGPRVECAFQSGLAAAKHLHTRITAQGM